MIRKYLTEIHTQPVHQRRRFAYGASALITLLIGFVWLTSFGVLNGIAPASSDTVAVATTVSSPSNAPFSLLGANISEAYDSLRGAFGAKTTKKTAYRNATATLEYVPD